MQTVIAFVAISQSAIEHQSRPNVREVPPIYRLSITLCRLAIPILRPYYHAYSLHNQCMIAGFEYVRVSRSAGNSDRMVVR